MRTFLFAFGIAGLVALLGAGDAHAEPEYEITVQGATITVKPKGNWHINKDFPWKYTVPGREPVRRDKFTFTDVEAVLRGAPGSGTLKGAVCSADACKPFEHSVTVH